MLQTIRERFTGGVAIAILAIIGVPFVFFGVDFPFLGAGYAAKVNGVEIPAEQLESVYQNQLLQYSQYGELPAEFRRQLKAGVLEQLIRNTLLDTYLAEAGYRISDQMVTGVIQREPEFIVDGQFSKERYYSYLDERAIDPARFEDNQRRGLRQSQLQRGLAATAFVTPADFRRYLNLYGELRRVAVATFEVDKAAEGIEVTEADIRQYYDEHPMEFQTPETVELAYLEVRRDALADAAEISEAEIREHYQASASRYLQDEQRRARHLLIPFGDDEAAAEEQARALTARAQAGEPFEDLARQYSKDGGTIEQGGDLGMIPKSQMPGALGDAIFAMQKGEIRGPVRSEFGFHVLRLDDVEAGGPLPLEQVRGELERELRERQADELFREKVRVLSDALFEGADLQSMAERAGLEVQTAAGYTRSGGAPFGSNQAAIDAVFDPPVLNEGRVSDIIEIDANRSAVLKVTGHREAARRPLDEVREQIAEAARLDRAQAIVQERVAGLQAALQDGVPFAQAAAGLAATIMPYTVINRLNEDLDPRVLEAIYRARKPLQGAPRIGSQVTEDGDYAVFSIDAVAPGRPESVPLADRDARKDALAAQAGTADYTAFMLQLEREADIVRRQDALAERDNF